MILVRVTVHTAPLHEYQAQERVHTISLDPCVMSVSCLRLNNALM